MVNVQGHQVPPLVIPVHSCIDIGDLLAGEWAYTDRHRLWTLSDQTNNRIDVMGYKRESDLGCPQVFRRTLAEVLEDIVPLGVALTCCGCGVSARTPVRYLIGLPPRPASLATAS